MGYEMELEEIKQEHVAASPAPNAITFTLPTCPPSVNSIWIINYREADPSRRVRIRDHCRDWKTYGKAYIPAFTISDSSIVRVDRTFYYGWFAKNGNWRKRDTGNMDKLLFDMISEKTGIDDRRFKLGMMDSVNSPTERTVVTLTEVLIVEWSKRV